MSHIFISYSRKDLEIAEKIIAALEKSNFKIWIDRKDIPKGEELTKEIYLGIERADAFLFLVSPDSVQSDWCNKEIDYAVKSSKRILPLIIRETIGKSVHTAISNRNWFFCRDGYDDFNSVIDEICKTIYTDYEWLKYHTKLQVKALDWERTKDYSRLLRGKELREAEDNLAATDTKKDPNATKEQREYVLASRRNEDFQQRRLTIGLIIVMIFIVVLSMIAWAQKNTAINEANARATAQAETLSGNLAAQAQLLMNKEEDADALLVGSLLAIESLRLQPNAEADEFLRISTSILEPSFKDITTSHTEAITILAISPDEEKMVSGDYNGYIKLWDIQNGKEISSLAINSRLSSIEFSQDNMTVFFGDSNGDISLWDATNSRVISFENHGGGYSTLDVSPNRDRLVTGGADGIIRITNLDTWEVMFELHQSSAIQMLRFTPDGSKIVSSGEDNTIAVWDTFTGNQKVLRLADYFGSYSIGISPDGNMALSGTEKGIELWDVITGESVHFFSHSYYPGDDTGFFSPDGRKIATYRSYNNSHVLIWDTLTGELISEINLEFFISGMGFSVDSRYMITSSEDGAIVFWDVETGNEVSRTQQEGRIYAFEISPTGKVLVTSGEDRIIHFWALPTPEGNSNDTSHHVKENFQLDPSGNWIASWDNNSREVELLEISSNTVIGSLSTSALITSGDISGNGEYIAIATEDQNTCVWKISSITLVNCRKSSESVSEIKFNNRLSWLATREDRNITIWDIETGQIIFTIATDFFANTFLFNMDDSLLAIGAGGDYKIELWDMNKFQKIAIFEHDPNVLISDLVFSKDGNWLISSSRDGTTRVWDLRSNKEISRLIYDQQIYPNMHQVLKTRLSPDQLKLLSVNTIAVFNINNNASTAREGIIRVWDPFTGNELNRFTHNSWVNDIIWSIDGEYVFSAGQDGAVRMWSVSKGNEAARIYHNDDVEVLGFTSDGSKLISISSDNEYKVSFWKPEDIIEFTCNKLTRNLTYLEWEKYFMNTEYHPICPNLPTPVN
jgi:WD40 repeat protein